MAFTFFVNAGNRDDKPSTESIRLRIVHSENTSTVHRAPIHVDLDVYYDAENQIVTINYDGESSGEVFLYYNNTLIGSETEINSSFQVSMNGLYKIEILTESWSAEGYFEL